jgi:hypothetical protein
MTMAFNPSPKVRAAAKIASDFQCHQVIILTINTIRGELEYASYGTTPKLCADAKKRADIAYKAVHDSYCD